MSKVEERTKNACHTWRPNVVLINAGTNDAKRTVPVSQTALDMRRLIDDVFAEVPNAVVVLSTLLPTKDEPAGAMEKARSINAEYRALVGQYVPDADADADDIAFKVMLAELDDGQFITLADIHDGTHPTDKGNQKMAAVWHSAIQEAERRGWLSEPSSTGEFEDGDTKEPTCRKEVGGVPFFTLLHAYPCSRYLTTTIVWKRERRPAHRALGSQRRGRANPQRW